MKAGTDADARARLERLNPHPNLDGHWAALEKLAANLETLAHKQLRGVAFRDDERQFIQGYGKALAHVMFYGGNSYGDAKDDAPRIVDVYRRYGRSLSVGVARPRVLWVVYPWQGEEVLCRGAVLPYHEFASADRLTDKEWLKRLDSNDAPDPPRWVTDWTVPREKK